MVRFGGPLFQDCSDPDRWIEALRKKGYTAAYCPVGNEAGSDTIKAFSNGAEKAGIVIAEVGAWSNPIGPDSAKSREAIEHCRKQLALADEIGARCCVNITGSRGDPWASHHPKNLTQETFDLIVQTTRSIVDAVKPKRSFFVLETMPWMYPDSVQSYSDLIHAIDREQCAVHFDPVNLINSPSRYYGNGPLIHEFVDRLGSMIKSCHAKDIILGPEFMVHLNECRPGTGSLDYATFLREIHQLPGEVPIMLEHLPDEAEYDLATQYVRSVAEKEGIPI